MDEVDNVNRTNYFETFVAMDDNPDWALSLEVDRPVNSFIAKKGLDSEMTEEPSATIRQKRMRLFRLREFEGKRCDES